MRSTRCPSEREGFKPPIALRLRLISSQVHSTGIRHLSDPGFVYRHCSRGAIEWMLRERVSLVSSFLALPRSLRDRGSADYKNSVRYGIHSTSLRTGFKAVPLSKTNTEILAFDFAQARMTA